MESDYVFGRPAKSIERRPAVVAFERSSAGSCPPAKPLVEVRMARRPEVVREKVSRIGGGGFACALIFDREFSPEEVARFRSSGSDGKPCAAEFEISGRVIRYECPEEEEARWRLAAEIFLVRAFAEGAGARCPEARPNRSRPPVDPV
jgi:hypothetical protein